MLDVAVIEDPAAAEASLDPIRARILAALAEPGSAAMLAGRLALPRQKVNYHLKELERHGLVELAEERRKGNVTERVYRATAASYVISPGVLAAVSPDPDRSPDQLSARWLLALGSRLVQEVGSLLTGAARARRRVATFGIDAQVRFASAADRTAFAEDLAQAVAALVSRYHDESAPGGRSHRVIVGLHQIPAAAQAAPPATAPEPARTPAETTGTAGTAAETTGTAPEQEDPR
ncbi:MULTISPECIES: helix-turn-helix domain-containing protein [unclassified Kitasatospora]|uniref:ArsR/SmtB family transcription factor n=1 Tax=unclassified Kitasatospora TaxID=2633591 RepID=UPI0033EB0B6A